ncbi:MAG: proprotein convertase P-domain-containing protein, partial [Planctomycetota bacterium]|nr:proprotein convertase P-domain-containing protein [Planctomycetota bacterium]
LVPPPGLLPANPTPLPPGPWPPPRGPIIGGPSEDLNSIKLFSGLGVEGENFHGTILDDEAPQSITQGSAPFAGSYKPEWNLSTLYGESIAGTWTLEVRDHMRNDVGKLNSWSLIIEKDFCSAVISSFPYYEFFEEGFGDWINVASDDIDWERHRNATDSSNTGPSSALSGNYYIYIESSKLDDIGHIGYPKKTAILESPCIEQLGDKPLGSIDSLSFRYHMYGAAMGTLIVEVSDDNGNSWTQLWSKSGNQGNSWHEATIDISEYAYKKIKLRFRGITGTNYTSDIAIDSISINQWGLSIPPLLPGVYP